MQSSSSQTVTTTMTVDIRLCGNIPRNEIKQRFGAPATDRPALTSQPCSLNISCLAETNGSPTLRKTASCDGDALTDLIIPNDTMKSAHNGIPLKSHFDLMVPSWAVPARGESRLQPVCESLGRQVAVDLTERRAFRIGRSPTCDVQLMHATSSRRHAMLFHHTNGSCYIIDCGSAHGTFVNGKRISSPSTTGAVVPAKVRRGSLIRFGGPGAPSFLLKSFSSKLSEAKDDENCHETKLVRQNTRLNAMGKAPTTTSFQDKLPDTIYSALEVARKRSFDSLSSTETLDYDYVPSKRFRCSSPSSLDSPIRLITPDYSKVRRVTFSMDPPQAFYPASVTPDEFSEASDIE